MWAGQSRLLSYIEKSRRHSGLMAGKLSWCTRLGVCRDIFVFMHLASALCNVFKGFVWIFFIIGFLGVKGV